MNWLSEIADTVALRWEAAGPRARLVVGALVVALIGMVGLTPKSLFGVPLAWPYVGLIAAVGWGRSGIAFAPMAVLVLFGFAQDASQAPWGAHGLANLLIFGLAALVNQTFDTERTPFLSFILPVVTLFSGIALVWLVASVSSGHVVRVTPMLTAYFATLVVHMLIAPLFDLGTRANVTRGGGV
ncbi:MAG: hypothetical protein AAFY82_10495 [Pseudomonadota bacterium]